MSYKITKIIPDKKISRYLKSRYLRSIDRLSNEQGTIGQNEIKLVQKRVVEKRPLQVGLAILYYSKLHMYELILFLKNILKKKSF